MDNRFSFWLIIGIAIGAAIGVTSHQTAKDVAWGAAIAIVLSALIEAGKRNIQSTNLNHKKK